MPIISGLHGLCSSRKLRFEILSMISRGEDEVSNQLGFLGAGTAASSAASNSSARATMLGCFGS